MKRFLNLTVKASFLLLPALLPAVLAAQQLEPTELLKKLGTTGDWATYGGDYTGRRYSSLTQLNQNTVKSLTLAWSSKLVAGTQGRRPGLDEHSARARARARGFRTAS